MKPETELIIDIALKLQQLNRDELLVIREVTKKMLSGKQKHGPLNLATDRRDFHKELRDEVFDAMCYVAMRSVQEERK
jgi:hypothetical protein